MISVLFLGAPGGGGSVPFKAADGSAAAPSYSFSADPDTGFYRAGSGTVRYSSNGTDSILFQGSGVINLLSNAAGIFFGSASDVTINRNGAAASLRLGTAAAVPVNNSLQIGDNSRPATDVNVGGANGTITSGNGTGNAIQSSLIFQTPTLVASGSGAQTQTTRLTLHADGATFDVPVIVNNLLRLRTYTVATLPGTGVQGDTAMVSDALLPTYLGALTGGGAVVCPVFHNGTAWRSG